MKSKVINLFGDKNVVHNQGVKYSELLEQFIEPFTSDFSEKEYYEDIIEFAINAWNFGNIKMLISEEGMDSVVNSVKGKDVNVDLLKRMVEFKMTNFKEYTNFITDYEVDRTGDNPILSIITQKRDQYLNSMMEDTEAENTAIEFKENYINRSAITLKPLQPFLDWFSNLYPGELDEANETNAYLVSEDIDDVEAWLKKKFDKLFMIELEGWHTNKKDWPKRRTYKMFKQWFQVDISTMVYDLENEPVSKL
ncbi:hypothetical protein [Aequorivita marina]|uniref:hypothetical protein n=1 Tax=Aequorivita marina TaxID=3073654 RepID=UPI00287645A0|nr:hypothetical protein [Aequorivita sp. S2608]MDS1299333.1 hypothetical protein [Aequorivita sp. S2608]